MCPIAFSGMGNLTTAPRGPICMPLGATDRPVGETWRPVAWIERPGKPDMTSHLKIDLQLAAHEVQSSLIKAISLCWRCCSCVTRIQPREITFVLIYEHESPPKYMHWPLTSVSLIVGSYISGLNVGNARGNDKRNNCAPRKRKRKRRVSGARVLLTVRITHLIQIALMKLHSCRAWGCTTYMYNTS